jgi:hypothetical protein
MARCGACPPRPTPPSSSGLLPLPRPPVLKGRHPVGVTGAGGVVPPRVKAPRATSGGGAKGGGGCSKGGGVCGPRLLGGGWGGLGGRGSLLFGGGGEGDALGERLAGALRLAGGACSPEWERLLKPGSGGSPGIGSGRGRPRIFLS